MLGNEICNFLFGNWLIHIGTFWLYLLNKPDTIVKFSRFDSFNELKSVKNPTGYQDLESFNEYKKIIDLLRSCVREKTTATSPPRKKQKANE